MKRFLRVRVISVIVMLLVLAGCNTRSISDSGYRNYWGGRGNDFSAELSEFDILGTAPTTGTGDADIAAILKSHKIDKPTRGERLLVIQSGALQPDTEMLQALSRTFDVAPFSGLPPSEKTAMGPSLRLRAAQGGYRYLFVYWGVLESGQKSHEGSVISWVPIAGSFIPDAKEEMRISLRGLLLDVSTGNWRMLTYQSPSESRQSARWSREDTDQAMVESLKRQGYQVLAEKLLD